MGRSVEDGDTMAAEDNSLSCSSAARSPFDKEVGSTAEDTIAGPVAWGKSFSVEARSQSGSTTKEASSKLAVVADIVALMEAHTCFHTCHTHIEASSLVEGISLGVGTVGLAE